MWSLCSDILSVSNQSNQLIVVNSVTYDDHVVVDYITAALVGRIAGIESSICTSDVVDCQRGPLNVVVTGSVIHENVSACAGLKTKETPLGDPDSWVGGVSTL